MPNKNYVKGRNKEYKICRQYRNKGFLAFRSAGSHSPIDVVCIHPETGQIALIQCKPNTMSENAKRKIIKENIKLNGLFYVRFLVC